MLQECWTRNTDSTSPDPDIFAMHINGKKKRVVKCDFAAKEGCMRGRYDVWVWNKSGNFVYVPGLAQNNNDNL